MKTLKELADIGAEASLVQLQKTQSSTSLFLSRCNEHMGEEDEMARQAFARAVKDAVEEPWIQREKDLERMIDRLQSRLPEPTPLDTKTLCEEAYTSMEKFHTAIKDAVEQPLLERIQELESRIIVATLPTPSTRQRRMETMHQTTTMTPTQLDHLRAIDAHLTALLDLAAKRTPGEWKVCHGKHGTIIRLSKDTIGEPMDVCRAWNCSRSDGNAAFIATCAGRAEAGWRATKAAIAFIDTLSSVSLSPCNGGSCMVATEAEEYLEALINKQAQDILTAWPLELLKL